ncbi:carboxylesterase/lipase family protein [Sunxiuqinia sp. A32]|uniref:carboxylesterase/lipase family protein n=1 Tax=Sunxiuqinia sp. A32 TaxID=3461496 RepID=UPI0040456BF6
MKKIIQISLMLVTVLFVETGIAQQNNTIAVQTKIENGVIEGAYDVTTKLQCYFGIPYALPPVGELRWKAPKPMTNWSGVKETKKFGRRPVQGELWFDTSTRSELGFSEDCLYLNVWTPAKKDEKGLPVYVYFYGGGFNSGDGSEPRYDGTKIAQEGVVVVTINYRLNVFGFFAHPELSAEAPYHASGNYGLLDQNAALKWVKNNIAAFGGDPNRVTIGGQSAGSLSVSVQMTSPLSKGLVHGAIGQSGAAIIPTLAPVPLKEGEKTGLEFAKIAGDLSLKELRALSTKDLWEIYTEKAKSMRFPLLVDGYVLPEDLVGIYKAKKQAQIPVLLGWNSAETPGFYFMGGKPFTPENYKAKLKEAYPEMYDEMIKVYPAQNDKEAEQSATAVVSDRFIGFCTWKWFDLQRKYSNQPVYRYLFNRVREEDQDSRIGAGHSSELEYFFGSMDLVKNINWTDDDRKVSETIRSYLVNFIKTGNPNGEGLAEWKTSSTDDSNPPVMIIDVDSKLIDTPNDDRYRFWDKVFYKGR